MDADMDVRVLGDDAADVQDNILSDDVVRKYGGASAIAHEALRRTLTSCRPGTHIFEICRASDNFILEETAKKFPDNDRGIAFPTSISLNGIVANYTPVERDTDPNSTIKLGDLVKVELGVHVDGYPAVLGHTFIVNPSPQQPVTGSHANVICAAFLAAEAALRMIKPGQSFREISKVISDIAAAYHVKPVEGTNSYLMKRYLLESEEFIPNLHDASTMDDQTAQQIIGTNDVVCLNIVMSTNPTASVTEYPLASAVSHVLQRDPTKSYPLRLATSRAALNDAKAAFGPFPFSTRALVDRNPKHRLALRELVSDAELLVARAILTDRRAKDPKTTGKKDTEEPVVVAQYKMTAIVLPDGTMRLTKGFEPPFVQSVYSLQRRPDIQELLNKNVPVLGGINSK
ncbi:peptidase M24, structural domain-containing protein [Zopfochytrium polystomum]|nr:peptidase M24, structural domain-containing protein [Zopfochytrium polystomum]